MQMEHSTLLTHISKNHANFTIQIVRDFKILVSEKEICTVKQKNNRPRL